MGNMITEICAIFSESYVMEGIVRTVKTSEEAIEELRKFGYGFNAAGELRKIDSATGKVGEEPFVFNISSDAVTNQMHYEQLAEQIPEIIYALLEQHGLKRIFIPFEIPTNRASFVFTYPDKLEQSKKLLVIMHGSGYVRAGQWARSLIINNSLEHGSQLPYIKRAKELGYDIVVTNTNDTSYEAKGRRVKIDKVSTPLNHAKYVWENLIMASNPESVAIVAHSYGGALVVSLSDEFLEFFKDKVYAIALTDSAHDVLPDKCLGYLQEVSLNWASSQEPRDKELSTMEDNLSCVSAGHIKHEWTSYAAIDSVFKYLEDKHEAYVSRVK